MTQNDKVLVESKGWLVTMSEPSMIHEETCSYATGIAVDYVIAGIRAECEVEDQAGIREIEG